MNGGSNTQPGMEKGCSRSLDSSSRSSYAFGSPSQMTTYIWWKNRLHRHCNVSPIELQLPGWREEGVRNIK